MRLTLRTMLAYLDDILEPEDTEDIGKKIEESEFATNLMHRVRDCMRRLRLGAPALVGRGLGADPNTVAEYLDNTLSPQRVGEFEKICLESDVHLAEVASCHQILTLVLGEPVEIVPESRQRMYQAVSHIDAPPVQSDAVKPPSPGASPPPAQVTTRRAKPEIPEYLRESRSRLWPVAAMLLVAAGLTFAALVAFGPVELRERLTALVQGPAKQAESEPAPGDQRQGDADQKTDPAAQETAATPTAATPKGTATPVVDDKSEDASDDAASGSQAPLQPTTIVAPQSDNASDAGNDPSAPPAPEPQGAGNPTSARPAARRPPVPPAAESPPSAKAAVPPATATGPPATVTGPPLEAGPTASVKGQVPDKPPAEGAAPPRGDGENFGRYTSKREILLRLDPASGDWIRSTAMSSLAKGDRLLSLPSFRPTVTLAGGITIQTDGAALFELTGWTDQALPIVAVEYGRLLMLSVGKAGNSLQIKLDDRQVELTFVDAESALAIEVTRVLPPGKDPEAGAATLATELYATSGSIRVGEGAAPVELQAPAHRLLLGARGGRPEAGEFPKWVSSEALSENERSATTTLEPLLLVERPVGLILRELSTHRRREVRSLAIRSSAYLGNFEACIAALNDKDERTLWSPYIDELRAAVARGPETAARVRSTLEKQRAADAAGLYRMLWGYTAEDLKNGADADLVDGLLNDSLDFRVLAFWNLQNITGLPSYGYHPSDQAKTLHSMVRGWKKDLRQGKIVPRSAPAKSKAPPKGTEKPTS